MILPRGIAESIEKLTTEDVVRRLTKRPEHISCSVGHFGEAGPEVFSEGAAVYISQDYPSYQRAASKNETHAVHFAVLLALEIAGMKDPRRPQEALEELLRNAFD